jgi:hypothetical protein
MCGNLLEVEELLGPVCGRCEKIAGDVEAEVVIESGRTAH